MPSNDNVDINEVLRQLRAGGNMPEELAEIFSEEAEEHMRNIYDGLDRLRVDPNDEPALSDVRRSSHTLKGAAGAVGFEAITRLAHRMEDLLDWLGDHKQGPNENQLQLLLTTADQIDDLTTSEIDFEEMAGTLIEIYGQYDKVMASLGTANVDPVGDDAMSANAHSDEEDAAEALGESQAEVPAVDVDEIRTELESGSTISDELAEIFAEEADEHLAAIGTGLTQLISDPADKSAAADVRRSAHTLKGAAGAVGMMSMHRLAWRVEMLLDALAESAATLTAEQVELLNESGERLLELRNGSYKTDDLTAALATIYGRYEQELALLVPAKQVQPETSNEVVAADAAGDLPKNTAGKGEAVEAKDAAQDSNVEPGKSQKQKAAANQPTQYLRVPLDRLDSLVSLVGEMVVNRSTFSQRLNDFADRIEEMNSSLDRLRTVASDVETRYSVEALQAGKLRERGLGVNRIKATLAGNEATDELDSLEFDRYTDFHLLARSLSEATNDIAVISSELRNLHGDFDSLINRQQRFNRDAQSNLMHVRMVPVGNIANRLDRTIRSVSNKLGKKIDLAISGENTELDKTVLEEITDPLLHLIRNAMDHGIETPAQRLSAGKPERSQLRIEALNQGTQVTIRVIDDGRGLDAEKIRLKAVERKLIREDQKLTKEETHALIFTPGFSTADALTDVSGRGVGMDVVREAVQRLKGTIQVESVVGVGSTFTIHLPTTLAVSNALLVESSGHTFAIPMQSVQQIKRLDPTAVTKVGAHPMINLGDRMLLLKDLANHMELRSDQEKFEETKAMLLIRTGDDEVAVTIDSIEGGQDIVVKSLGDHLRHVPGYLGATVSGDGTVIPILDPADLCGQESSAKRANRMRRRSDNAPKIHRKTAMVVDDSLSVRRVTTNLLRSFGWEVIDAKDGVDALEKLAAADTPPDVFLCDMEMPRMDGLELVSRIRSQAEFRTTPVVMVTSRAGEKHRKLAREAGADEHVVKPFNDENLIGLIDRMVTEHRELVGV
ncbi:hybrid sensor histidine kinase/response regulator [Mariniblastus fucicola]|uniref:histidine kinase n=1 Tax=Mariniblastus fucicola TaxID=980251 RepID=A0A5B9P588_9BACT|nr:hybrid sensor histidine kinase/response regulator [Mariniblastus fucicola]QEG21434.1 Chemotaxis protein CheA [Mariniblastus fucicola]